mgnify:CR=1 FL=1
MKRKMIWNVAAALGLFIIATPVFAADFLAPAKDDNGSIVVGSEEKHKNLYVAGANLTVNGDTQGDLYAAGSQVTIDGATEQDVVVAGGSIGVNGRVGGDARVAGGTVTINSPVGGDLLVGGGNVNITQKTTIGGDAAIGAGTLILDAPVAGSLKVAGKSLVINSKIAGSVWIRSSGTVTFGPKADIDGKIYINAPKEAVVKEGAKISTPEFTKYEVRNSETKKGLFGLLTAFFLVKLVAYFITALVLWKLLGNQIAKVSEYIQSNFWKSTGVGFLVAVVGPIAAIILLVTLVGYYLAFITLAVYALLVLISASVAGVFIGSWLMMKITKTPSMVFSWQSLLLGVVVIMVIGFIPVIGSIANAIIILAALGAVSRWMWTVFRQSHN